MQDGNRAMPGFKSRTEGTYGFYNKAMLREASDEGGPVVYLAPDGDDAWGDGTRGKPYRTFRCAQLGIKPGTVVYLTGGVYDARDSDAYVINGRGTAENWITFRNAPGERAVLDGGGEANTGKYDGIVNIRGAEFVCFEGIEVTGNLRRWGQGVTLADSHYVIIRQCKVHGVSQRGLGGSGTYLLYEQNEVYNTCLSNEEASHDPSGGWPFALGTNIQSDRTHTRHVMFIGNTVRENWGEGINSWCGADIVIAGNTIYDNFSVNLYMDTSNEVWVEGNTIRSENPRFNRLGQPANGILIANERHPKTETINPRRGGENIMILNNHISGTRNGIQFWFDAANQWESNTYQNVTIEGNRIEDVRFSFVDFNRVSSSAAPAPSGNVMKGNEFIGQSAVPVNIDASETGAWEMDCPSGTGNKKSHFKEAHYELGIQERGSGRGGRV
jgi:hypothetical protein